MVAFPAATAVTLPFVSTVATLVLLELHETFLFVALFGETVAMICCVQPLPGSVVVVGFNETPLTATVEALTVTSQVAL
jgi:hypothetical protein